MKQSALSMQWDRASQAGRSDKESVSDSWAGRCGHCDQCRDGNLVSCLNQEFTGVHQDGGYAEVLIAKASGLVSIPKDLSFVNAAPLLCAG
jgi:D-arabinose 1-dehydrogenase-like Zn-dependent alcohol dehydrogenase